MATNIKKNTAKLMMKKLQARLDALYNEQESLKPKTNVNNVMRGGGMIKRYADGDTVPYWERQGTDYQGGTYGGNQTAFDPFSNIDFQMEPEVFNEAPIPGSIPQQNEGFNWQNAGLSALGMAPNIYNLAQGLQEPESLNAADYANPQYNQSINLMSNRRYNVNPALEAIRTSERIGRRNMREAGSAGQYLSGLGALSAGRMRAESDVFAQKQNMDNQYKAEEAQMRGTLGSESAQNAWRVSEANAMNRAARRQHIGAATTGISNWAQLQQLGKNKKEMDLLGLGTLLNTDWFKERFPDFFDYYTKNKTK